MSKSLVHVVIDRAIRLWSDPKHRCRGVFRRKSKYGMQYCAIGVLEQARKECGIKGNDLPMAKIVRSLGYRDRASVMNANDRWSVLGGATIAIYDNSEEDDYSTIDRVNQDEIYKRMVDFVKAG